MTPGEFRLRVRYGKVCRLRWLSHLEIVHTLERIIRRAGLPYAITQGFNPHLKAAFGPALPVGTGGNNEYFDVWLTRYTEASEALGLLRGASPADLAPIEARYVAGGTPSLTAVLTIAQYDIEVDGKEIDSQKMRSALAQILSAGEFAIEHKGKHKVYDLTRSIPEDARVGDRDGGVIVELTVRMGPEGSLRPEILIRAALKAAEIETTAVRTTRRDTLVEDDEGVWSRPV